MYRLCSGQPARAVVRSGILSDCAGMPNMPYRSPCNPKVWFLALSCLDPPRIKYKKHIMQIQMMQKYQIKDPKNRFEMQLSVD